MNQTRDDDLSLKPWKVFISIAILIWSAAQIYTGFAYHLNLPEHTGIPQVWPFRYTYYMFIRDTPWMLHREIWGQKADYGWTLIDTDQLFRYPVSSSTRRHEEVNFPSVHAWRKLATFAQGRHNAPLPTAQQAVRIYVRDCIWAKEKGRRPDRPPLNQCPYYQVMYDSYYDADFSPAAMSDDSSLPKTDR